MSGAEVLAAGAADAAGALGMAVGGRKPAGTDGGAPAARGALSTGDELVMPGEPLPDGCGRARSTTRTASRSCAALLRRLGCE